MQGGKPFSRSNAAHWRSFPPFETLEEDTLAAISALSQTRVWQAGALLFQKGDPGDWMVALTDGRVRVDISSPGGRSLTLRIIEPGECFGEMSLFDGLPRSATATAMTAITAHVLSKSDYRRLTGAHPDILDGMVRWLARRLRETTDQLAAVALLPLEARTAWYLLRALKALHGIDETCDVALDLSINQSEIALMLGASRPKVNQALLQLTHCGAVERRRNRLICRADLLAGRIEVLSR